MLHKLQTLLSQAILGKTAGMLPINALHLLSAGQIDLNTQCDLLDFHLVHSADCFDCSDKIFNPAAWMVSRYALNEKRIIGIRNATIYPSSGGVVTRGNKVLTESVGSLYKLMTYSSFINEASRNRFRIGKRGNKVIVPGVGGFYHWMFESLPGLIRCADRYPEHQIVLPKKQPKFVSESLEILFGADWKDRVIATGTPLHVDEAIFYSKSFGGQFIHPKDISLIRDRLSATIETCGKPQKIYISRRYAKARSIDESPVIEVFQNNGFSIIELEKHSFKEQIQLVANASHLAGYHGAGFSLGVFTPSNCRFLEIFRPDYLNDCYTRILRTIGRDYRYLVSDNNLSNSSLLLEEAIARFLAR